MRRRYIDIDGEPERVPRMRILTKGMLPLLQRAFPGGDCAAEYMAWRESTLAEQRTRWTVEQVCVMAFFASVDNI